jgi:hypothetical protein
MQGSDSASGQEDPRQRIEPIITRPRPVCLLSCLTMEDSQRVPATGVIAPAPSYEIPRNCGSWETVRSATAPT